MAYGRDQKHRDVANTEYNKTFSRNENDKLQSTFERIIRLSNTASGNESYSSSSTSGSMAMPSAAGTVEGEDPDDGDAS